MRCLLAFSLLAAPLFTVPPAVAAPITAIFDIESAGFADVLGNASAPVDPVSLVVSLSFDSATGDQFDNTAGLRVLRSSLAITGGLAFDYDSAGDVLTFGGAGLAGIGLTAGTADVLAEVDAPYTGHAGFGGFIYATDTSPGLFESFGGSVAVPEPGSATLLLGGLALLAIRRRKNG